MRPYSAMDVGFPGNRKLLGIHPACRWVWIEMIDYCSHMETDGIVPSVIVRRFASSVREWAPDLDPVADLLRVRLIERADEDYCVHDYLEHQKSHERIEAERKQRAEVNARYYTGRRNGKNADEHD